MYDKYCPLSYRRCRDEDCSWWVDEEEKCAILIIAEYLKGIYGRIAIKKEELRDRDVWQDSREEAIKAAIERNKAKLEDYKRTIPLLEKEIEELNNLLKEGVKNAMCECNGR